MTPETTPTQRRRSTSFPTDSTYKQFKAQVGPWGSVSENAYYSVIADKYALKK